MISEILPSIFAMVFCILMSAYFSTTETAFSSLNKIRIKVLAESGNRRAQLTYRLSEDYDRLISTILIGNNIVNIAVASIGTLLFVKLYGDIGATLSTVVVTVVVLIFGEITPKRVAKDFPEIRHVQRAADLFADPCAEADQLSLFTMEKIGLAPAENRRRRQNVAGRADVAAGRSAEGRQY